MPPRSRKACTTKILALILAVSHVASAQVTTVNGSYVCPLGAVAFCASKSLSSNIIIRCIGVSGIAGNCNDNLAGVPPEGVKTSALCYQSSTTAGDAACSFNGTVYPDNGSPFPIPTGPPKPLPPSPTGTGASQSLSMTTRTTTLIETGVTKTVTTTVPCSTSTSIAVTILTSIASGPSGVFPPHPSLPSNSKPPYPSSNTTTSIVPVVPVPGTGTGTGTGTRTGTGAGPTSATTTFTHPLLPTSSSSSMPWYSPSSLSSSYPPKSPSAPSSSLSTPTGTSSAVTSTSTVAPSNGAGSAVGSHSRAGFFAGLLSIWSVVLLV